MWTSKEGDLLQFDRKLPLQIIGNSIANLQKHKNKFSFFPSFPWWLVYGYWWVHKRLVQRVVTSWKIRLELFYAVAKDWGFVVGNFKFICLASSYSHTTNRFCKKDKVLNMTNERLGWHSVAAYCQSVLKLETCTTIRMMDRSSTTKDIDLTLESVIGFFQINGEKCMNVAIVFVKLWWIFPPFQSMDI